jgi:hypothetical protein
MRNERWRGVGTGKGQREEVNEEKVNEGNEKKKHG